MSHLQRFAKLYFNSLVSIGYFICGLMFSASLGCVVIYNVGIGLSMLCSMRFVILLSCLRFRLYSLFFCVCFFGIWSDTAGCFSKTSIETSPIASRFSLSTILFQLMWPVHEMWYSTCLRRSLKNIQNKDLNDKW